MRNVRALCSLAVIATAFGCGGSKEEEAKAPSEPTAEPAPPATAGEAQQPPPAAEPGMAEGTQPGQAPPGGTGQAAPAQPPPAAPQLSSNDLMVGTISCILGPVMMHSHQMGSTGMHGGQQQGESMGGGPSGGGSDMPTGGAMIGPNSDRCMTTAKAANVPPAALYKADPQALDSVRKAMDSRLSAEGASSDAANNSLTLYDKGVAAAKEARTSHDTLELAASAAQAMRTKAGSANAPKSGAHHGPPPAAIGDQTADQIRAHTALSDLYQYGRNLGATESGTQAQALAWVIGANRFMEVSSVPPQAKSLVAEPLFSSLLNVPPPAPAAGRVAPAWNEYLAAAARSVSATSSKGGTTGQAVGGGPVTSERANLDQVVKTTEERMQVLGQQLPFTSQLRSEVDRTIAGLHMVEETGPTAPPPSTQKKGSTSGSQQKPKSTPPSQPPKKQPTQ
jgi:hypothetical protein